MVNSGHRHALVGSSESLVEKYYGPRVSEHERKDANGLGIQGVVYQIGTFAVGVEFQKRQSVRECWVKTTPPPDDIITGAELTAILHNKAYGPGWSQLSNSSPTRLWYRSDTSLIACCDYSSSIAGGCALTIFDPGAGTPEGLPALPTSTGRLPGSASTQRTNILVALTVAITLGILVMLVIWSASSPPAPETPRPTTDTESLTTPNPWATENIPTPMPSPELNASPTLSPPPFSTTPVTTEHARPIIQAPQPLYPFAAQRDRLRGSGKFKITFTPDGKPSRVEVARTTGSRILDDAAIKALWKWRAKQSKTTSSIVVPITLEPPARR